MSDGRPKNGQSRYLIPGLQRGLAVLALFNRNRIEISGPEISKELSIPRSTVFRLLVTLENLGFLERAKNGHDYRLGVAMLKLGFEYLGSLEITELARPVLDHLRDETGFTAHLAIRTGSEVVFVLKAMTTAALVSSVTIGTRLPAHATVLGRVFLADLSDAEIRELYPRHKLELFSAQTPKTVDELIDLVRRDGARGYAISEAFFERGICAIAAPVRDASGRVVAAINIIIPEMAADQKELGGSLARQVTAAAHQLSLYLDYNPARDSGRLMGKEV